MEICIIGAGKLGTDIFNYLLDYNFTLSLICKGVEDVENLRKKTIKKIERLKKSGIIDQDKYDNKINNTKITTNLNSAEDCDILIEAISEDLFKKRELFNNLKNIIKNESIICSNSSSFIPSELFTTKEWQDRFIGLHFFYPIKLKSIVEIIKNKNTPGSLISTIKDFLKKINKQPLVLEEESAFILNKIYLDIQSLAYIICIENELSFKKFDQIIKDNLFPIGIFESIDSVGIDITLTSIKNYSKYYSNKDFYQPLIDKLEELLSNNTNFQFNNNYEMIESKNIKSDKENLIVNKILYALINSIYKIIENKISSAKEIENAMKEYLVIDKGPIELSNEIGISNINDKLMNYYNESNQDIFYPSGLLK